MDDDVANTLTMTAEEYAEERVRQAIHFAGLPYGMTMLRHAFRRGEIRLKDVVDAQEMPLGAARKYMWRMQRIGLFEKRYASQRDVVYVLTSDGLAVAQCLERLFHSAEESR